MDKVHEYQWLCEAFSLNTSLHLGSIEKPKEAAEKLKSHLYDLKDLRDDLESMIDEIE